MERRKFNIEISTYGWEIDIIGFVPPYSDYEPIDEAPISFGICVKEDDKVMALYDPFCPRTEAIKEANELPIFLEECKFYDNYNKHEIVGTFIDALIYIQKKYIDGKVSKLEEIYKDKE